MMTENLLFVLFALMLWANIHMVAKKGFNTDTSMNVLAIILLTIFLSIYSYELRIKLH